MKHITFLHTSSVHILTFEQLLRELAPGITARHIVDEALLDEARAEGITPRVQQRVAARVQSAAQDSAMVLCTCSTIGGVAERVVPTNGATVLRVDRPMAARAVAIGTRIILAAALASTLAPTRALVLDEAERAGKTVQISELLVAEAWQHFEAGHQRDYLETIAAALERAAPSGDVLVLAQASMAGAAILCPNVTIPILSSPRLGLKAALSADSQMCLRFVVRNVH